MFFCARNDFMDHWVKVEAYSLEVSQRGFELCFHISYLEVATNSDGLFEMWFPSLRG